MRTMLILLCGLMVMGVLALEGASEELGMLRSDMPSVTAWELSPRQSGVLVKTCRDSFQVPRILGNYVPTAHEQRVGLVVTGIGMSEDVSERYALSHLPRGFLQTEVLAGERRSLSLLVIALRDMDGLSVFCDDLRLANEHVISRDCLDVRHVADTEIQTGRGQFSRLARYLLKKETVHVPAGETYWLWLTVRVSRGAQPGMYRGNIGFCIRGTEIYRMPLTVRVSSLAYSAPLGHWGMYLPGHLHGRSVAMYRNYVPTWWRRENLDPFFRFYASRHLTSCHLYLPYPDLRYEDGQLTADFSDLEAIVTSARRNGVTGKIVIDVRPLEFFAHAVTQLKGKKEVVVGYNGLHSRLSGQAYSARDREIFGQLVKQLTERAGAWGDIGYLPEEELTSTRYVDKPAGYDAFVGVLKDMVGAERVVLVDNQVGYPAFDVDVGARDGIGIRQYNSWTEAALARARADGAEIWAFNYGYDRFSFGILSARLGATGNHQWADAFEFYQFSLVEQGRVLPSLQYERMCEGLGDLALFRRLLAERGNSAVAERLREILRGIPVRRHLYMNWKGVMGDDELDALRHLAVSELEGQGGSHGEAAPAGRLEGTWPIVSASFGENKDSQSDIALCPYGAKGMEQRSLFWTGERERYLRRASSCESDFRRMGPRWNRWRCSYDDVGLRLEYEAMLGTGYRAQEAKGTAGLWQDDSLEVFWRMADTGLVRHFIVNLENRSVLLERSLSISHDIVSSVDVSRQGEELRGIIRLLLPWKTLGFPGMPLRGESLEFNVAFENHTLRQNTIWSQVENRFGVGHGHLKFQPKPNERARIREWTYGNSYVGRQRLVLALTGKEALEAELTDYRGRRIWLKKLPAESRIEECYQVPSLSADGAMLLQLRDAAGESVLGLNIPLSGSDNRRSGMALMKVPVLVRKAFPFVIHVDARIGTGEASGRQCQLLLRQVSSGKESMMGTVTLRTPGLHGVQVQVVAGGAGGYELILREGKREWGRRGFTLCD